MVERTVIRHNGESVTAARALAQPPVRLESLLDEHADQLFLAPGTTAQERAGVETAMKYAGYLRQEASRAERARREEQRRIPGDFPFHAVPGLSREACERLSQVRPETLGQASRIPGLTPAAIMVLGAYVGRIRPQSSSVA